MKICDIIVPVWNHPEFTRSCIEGLLENTRYPHRLLLIDNGSQPETGEYLESLKKKNAKIKLLRNAENLGFIKAVNQGLALSDAPYVCVLNNDTLPGPSWLSELVDFAEKHPDMGLLNPLSSGHAGRNMTIEDFAGKVLRSGKNKYMEMNQCQGFCMLIKREVIEKIGYLDERFGIGGFDDTDYSMRAHLAGYKCACVYSAYVYHREHKTFDKLGDRKALQKEAEKRYFEKWPRHKRIAIAFSPVKNTSDKDIEKLLNSALSLAREWCWVSLWVFGSGNRVEAVKEKMSFPLHQNIKFSYPSGRFKRLQIAVRILERSFGKKRRKKYDEVRHYTPCM